MALEDKVSLWSKLNESLIAEIGSDGAWVGTDNYEDCKFEKGADNDSVANYPTFPDDAIIENAFMVEQWFKGDGWNCVNGDPSDGADKGLFGWWADSSNWIQCHFSASSNAFFLRFRINGATVNYISSDPAFTFLSGALQHILMAFKQSGIEGGPDICRIYFNGNLVFTSTTAPLVQPNGPGIFLQNVYKGASIAGAFEGCIDNIKIYNVVDDETIAEVLANRENEGFARIIGCRTVLEMDICAGLTDIKELIYERGGAVKIILRDEGDVNRDGYNSIEKRAQNSIMEIYAYPADFSPSQKQIEKAGLSERSDLIIWTAMLDWNNNGIASFENIEFSGKSTVIYNGVNYDIKEKNVVSQLGNTYGYVTLGLSRK